MKFTRADCWINSLISNRDKNATLMIFLFSHYCWSLLCCNYWRYFKGNPNFQDILNWILQILHYYCRKQHKNIKNSRIIEQNLVLSFPFSLFTATCASVVFLNGRNVSFLEQSTSRILNVTSDHSCCIYSFVFWFENDFHQV